jgi:glutamyl-tRNA synthetase
MIELFTLERVSKGAASLDAKKQFAFQERYFQLLSVEERVARVLPYLTRAGLVADSTPPTTHELVTRIVADAGPRLVVAGDILNFDDFFLPDDRLPYDDKAFDKHVRKAPDLLKKVRAVLANSAFDGPSLKAAVEAFATAEGVKPGPISQMLRVAATGKEIGFGTYETLAILGRDKCLARIDRALGRL